MKILNTPVAQIDLEKGQYILKLRMSNGQYILCKPYENDLKGIISALTLAIDALAGKVWLDKIDEPAVNKPEIEGPKMIE